MHKLIISGCNGHMGRVVEALCSSDPEITIAAGFDILGSSDKDYPVFSSPALFADEADAVIDFSSPAALSGLLEFAVAQHIPLVLATTGYTPEQVAQVEEASRKVPIFRSANMSLGVNVLMDLVKRAAAILGGHYDIEIVERHHRRKVDAPSGTALMLADAAKSALPYDAHYVYDRSGVRQARDSREIGISSVRGGTIVGEHEVIFAGHDEVIEIRHSAASREIFANGAIQAAKFIAAVKEPGLYDRSALIAAM